MGRRSDVNWEAIERDYRIGQLSVREIARQHGVAHTSITRRAKKHVWTQDLSEEVRRRTDAALVTNAPPNAPQRTTDSRARGGHSPEVEASVDKAVRTNIEVLRQHRSYIGDALRLAAEMLADLKEARANKAEIVAAIDDVTKNDVYQSGKPDPRRRNMMLKAIGLDADAGTLSTIGTMLARVIPLERQAFNIDKDTGKEDSELSKPKTLIQQIQAIPFTPREDDKNLVQIEPPNNEVSSGGLPVRPPRRAADR